MPRGGNLAIQFGKILLAGDGSTTMKDLEETLGRILKEHGYPEEFSPKPVDVKPDVKMREPTMDEIEILASKLKRDV